MKQLVLLFTFMIFFSSTFAQTNIFPASGNVGIGTVTPTVKLQIIGGAVRLNDPSGFPFGFNINMHATGGWAREYGFSTNDSAELFAIGALGSGAALSYGYIGGGVVNKTSYSSPWMVFLPTGNIGIGTNHPQSKLAVNGTVTAKQIKVTQTGWPDYVFDTAYNLPSLEQLAEYIKKYKHLPKISSSKEVVDHGLDLGDMQSKQMQKIEELTLYVIRQNEVINKQQKVIEKLSERVEKLENTYLYK